MQALPRYTVTSSMYRAAPRASPALLVDDDDAVAVVVAVVVAWNSGMVDVDAEESALLVGLW